MTTELELIRDPQQVSLAAFDNAEPSQEESQEPEQPHPLAPISEDVLECLEAHPQPSIPLNKPVDMERKKKVNMAALNALAQHAGLSPIQAKQVVIAIAKFQIPAVTIQYR